MEDEYLPEEHSEESDRLFERLAAEEPPLDLDSDTAPSKTAPRPAVRGDQTQPVRVREEGGGRCYLTTVAIGIVLTITLVITVLIFLQGDSNQTPLPPTDVAENNPTPTVVQVTEQLPTAVPTATSVPQQVVAQIPPTAAADELGAWLLTPVDNQGGSGVSGITRQDDAFTITGTTGRLHVEPYTVVSGDTLSGIADHFGLDICTLVWSNPRNSVSPLRPGKILDILPVDGVFYKVEHPVTIQQVADDTSVSPFDIIDSNFNDLFGSSPDSLLVEGMKIVVPKGDGGNCNIWAPAPGGSGTGVASGGSGGGSLWGCSYTVTNPGFPGVTPVAGNYTFFQGFSAVHTGVDLAAPTGTSVVASGSGTVAFAGWNDYGYGNAIVIDHGGSYTLYGHLSAINVSCGQSVGAGETIGAVGSTGHSSGPHLHFEIRDAGFNPVDPTYSIRL